MENKTEEVEGKEECLRVEKEEVNVENLNEVAFVTNNGGSNLSCVLSQSIETEFESHKATVETELETGEQESMWKCFHGFTVLLYFSL